MIQVADRVCTICARGGSKGVKGKNMRHLLGRPLLEYTLEQAKRSKLFSLIAFSSDSDELLQLAEKAGANVLVKRPAEMASDTAGKLPAIRHCLETAETVSKKRFKTSVDLDVTSPLRLVQDIKDAVNLLETSGSSNVITGAVARRSPYFSLVEEKPDGTVDLAKKTTPPVVRRQDAPKCYDMNGSIYVWKREVVKEGFVLFQPDTRIHLMPEDRSIDIDSELDFKFVEFIAKENNRFKEIW